MNFQCKTHTEMQNKVAAQQERMSNVPFCSQTNFSDSRRIVVHAFILRLGFLG